MRGRGANARLHAKFELLAGTPPAGNYIQLPFVSSNLGAEQGLIESDLLGQGREGYDPTLDVVTNDGDVVVPVDARAFGYWLMLAFGEPVTAAKDKADGSIIFSAQPAANSTITINGTVFTFKAAGAAGNEINKGADLEATLAAAVVVLNASGVAEVAAATYSSNATTLSILHDAAGVGGNAFSLAAQAASNGKVSGATLSGGTNSHTFTSGADSLPSMSIETAMPDVPSFEMNYLVRLNTLRIDMGRRGLLNATLGLIAKGSAPATTVSAAGNPTAIEVARFAQATGEIKKDGVQLGSVVSARLGYSNNLDKVETIRPDGEIEDADPGMSTAAGNVTVVFADHVLLDKATGRDPVELSFGWSFEDFSLVFNYERVLLPKPKRPINGPKGIQTSFDWQASGADGNVTSVVLVNDVAVYELPA